MSSTVSFRIPARICLVVAGIMALTALASRSSIAAAQSTTLDAFRPAASPRDGFALQSTETAGRLRLDAQLYLDYANDPLVYEYVAGSSANQRRIVANQLALHALVSLTVRDRALVYIGLPVNAVMSGVAPNGLPVFPADGASLGDVYLGARVRLYGDASDGFSLAAQGALYLPSSQYSADIHYAGDETIRLHAQVLGQYRLSMVRINANLGGMFRGKQNIGPGVGIGQQLTFGVGAMVPLLDDRLAVLAELDGSTTFDDFFSRSETTLEFLVGARYFHESGLSFGAGGGPGLARGYGSPDVRILGTVAYSREFQPETTVVGDTDGDGLRDDVDGCVNEPEDMDSFQDGDGCPDPDNDSDGILDAADSCPLEAEDVDTFEDENGCPDPDNDSDGVLDTADSCPLEAEDVDGFDDANGCPDPDNDGDSVLDGDDRCPIEAGVVSNHGCPEPDRDGDTVGDRFDNCPDEAGTVENHGCRDAQLVELRQGQLAILEKVYFRVNSATIDRRSFGLLDQVAAVLVAHSEILRVRVEGHTDARGNAARNVTLSQRRVNAVMTYLTRKGVSRDRLEAVGYGSTRPVVPNATTEAEHEANRRVEFTVLQYAEAAQ